MCPIVGMRYKLKGHNYDLCEAEFNKLPAAEQAKYDKIDPPQSPAKSTLTLTMGGNDYDVDLQAMTQTKRASGFVRAIRIVAPSVVAPDGAAAGRIPVGTRVKIVAASDFPTQACVGKEGKLVKDDNSDRPFKIKFGDGLCLWFKQAEVVALPAAAGSPPGTPAADGGAQEATWEWEDGASGSGSWKPCASAALLPPIASDAPCRLPSARTHALLVY